MVRSKYYSSCSPQEMADDWEDDTPASTAVSSSSNNNDNYGKKSGGYGDNGDRSFRRRDDDENGGGGYRNRRDNNSGDKPRFNRDRNNDDKSRFNRRDEDGDGGDRPRFRRRDNDENGDDDKPRFRKRNGDDGEDKNGDRPSEPPKEIYIPPEPSNDENELYNLGIRSGINFEKYDSIAVNVSDNISQPISTFAESGLRDLLKTNVSKSGYERPTPIQRYAIPTILSGRDIMGCAQTGSGKTAAFLLPMINKIMEDPAVEPGRPNAIIVSPTRELAIQIFNEARKFALHSMVKVAIAYGGTAVRHQSENIAKGCHILVATPGRLMDFVERGTIALDKIKFVVLDEADRMLDMGFKESIEKLMKHPDMIPTGERQTLMFSATFPKDIQVLAGQFLSDYGFISVGNVGGACTDVKQEVVAVGRFEKRKKLIEILDESANEGGVIVFVETQRNADFLASYLSETKYPTTSIHGARLQREREMALSDFTNGKMKILVATSVAARGLDIKNVTHVINYDMPKQIDDYVHRIGRTGRVGNQGRATSFFDAENDGSIAADLARVLKEAGQDIPECLDSYTGGSYSANAFGAADIRGGEKSGGRETAPKPNEEDEEW